MAPLLSNAWFWWLTGALLAAVALPLLAWSLIGDRARGRRRCPKCWYDMAGVGGLTCPECGRVARHERTFARARRRWRWAIPALILAVAAPIVAYVPSVQSGQWRSHAPAWLLVFLYPRLVGTQSDVAGELVRRLETGSVSRSQRRRLAARACAVLATSTSVNSIGGAYQLILLCGPDAPPDQAVLDEVAARSAPVSGFAHGLQLLYRLPTNPDQEVLDSWSSILRARPGVAAVWAPWILAAVEKRVHTVQLPAEASALQMHERTTNDAFVNSAIEAVARLPRLSPECLPTFRRIMADAQAGVGLRYWASLGSARLAGIVKNEREFHQRALADPDAYTQEYARRFLRSRGGEAFAAPLLRKLILEAAGAPGYNDRAGLRAEIDRILNADPTAQAELRRIAKEAPDPIGAWARTLLRERNWPLE